jgi:hypothetical protein
MKKGTMRAVALDRFRTYPLSQVAEAHRALDDHHLGKLALRIE